MSQLKPSNPKDYIGSTKLPLHLWPLTATAYGSLALLDGECKYGRSNFRAVGVRASVYYDAALRHLGAWFEGEDCDPDSGVHHLGHGLACLAILVEGITAGNLVDDRNYPTQHRKLVDALTPMVNQIKQRHADKHPKHYDIQSGAQSGELGVGSE